MAFVGCQFTLCSVLYLISSIDGLSPRFFFNVPFFSDIVAIDVGTSVLIVVTRVDSMQYSTVGCFLFCICWMFLDRCSDRHLTRSGSTTFFFCVYFARSASCLHRAATQL